MENVGNKQLAGELKISKDVIAAIAKVAALETDGVDSLMEPRAVRGLFSRMKKPITIGLIDDFADIEICVNLKYGAHIPKVCTALQTAVKDSVQIMTGKAVAKVNVLVSGIVFPEDVNDK